MTPDQTDVVREWEPLELPDGRTLTAAECGDPGGVPVVYLHGTGGSRLEQAVLAAEASAHGVRLLSWDRPGAGGSTPLPGRRLLDVVDDARAVAARAGVARVAVVGFSGGGSHALALGAAAPDLVAGVVVLNPGPPADHPSVAAMGRAQAFAIRAAGRRPRIFRFLTRANNARPDPRKREKVVRGLPPEDQAVVRDPVVGPLFERSADEGARQPSAWTDDALVIWGGPWGVELSPYPVPLHVVSTAGDGFTAFADALAADGAVLHRPPGGHLAAIAAGVRDDVVEVSGRLARG